MPAAVDKAAMAGGMLIDVAYKTKGRCFCYRCFKIYFKKLCF